MGSDDAVEHVERDGSRDDASSTLVAGDVDVNSGKFAVTASDGSLAISSNKFTVAGDTGNTVVSGHLAVGGPTGDSAKEVYVTGDIEATGTLAIGGDATFAGAVTVTGLFTALGDYRIGDSAPSDSLTVNAASNYTGTTTMSNTLDVIGAATLESTLSVGGATTLSSTLGVVSDVRIGAVGARKLVVSGSDGSLAIQTNKFTVAGNTGNTVVAGTLDAGGTTLSSLSSGAAPELGARRCRARWMSSRLDVGREQWEVCGDGRTGRWRFRRTSSRWLATRATRWSLDAGGTTLNVTTLSSTLGDAVEHAGCGRRRGREQWEVCGDGIGRVAGNFVEQVHGGWQHGQHGGGGGRGGTTLQPSSGADSSTLSDSSTLNGSCDAVEHAGCGRRRGRTVGSLR